MRYDEDSLVARLAALHGCGPAAFAAACAERLTHIYHRAHALTGRGDPAGLDAALSALWMDLESRADVDLAGHLATAESLVPDDEEDDRVDEYTFAAHAAAAVAYAIRSRLSSHPREAAWAARQVYEALDFRIVTRDDIDLNAPGAEDRIAEDPLIQAELARQARDLETLAASGPDLGGATLAAIRGSARRIADEVFDL